MSDTIRVQYQELEALAGELTALAAELVTEAELCRSATFTFGSAANGETGAGAVELGTAWARLVELLGQGTGAVGESVRTAVRSYRLHDAALSDRHLYVQQGIPYR